MVNKKKAKKKTTKQFPAWVYAIFGVGVLLLLAIRIGIRVTHKDGEFTIEPVYKLSETQIDGIIGNDLGDYDEEIMTIEEIDGGGKFKDILDLSNTSNEFYYELGAMEDVDTSSPEAFKRSTLGRCIVANNYYGAQCVSLARAFWWSYAGFDVTTCGTGLAKGMMNCSEDNARDKFKVIWNTNEIQNGTWIVLDGSMTGHICMALGKVVNGYVSCLGENQGGIACEYGIGGAGTNIINISVKNFIGGYTPIDYIEPEPKPEPAPIAPDTGRL